MTTTRVLLVNPFHHIEKTMGKLAAFAARYRPSGLLSLAAYLEKIGYAVAVYDAQVATRSLADIVGELRPHIVGITSTTPVIQSALATSREIRDLCPDVPILLGGIHPSVLAEETLRASAADVVVRGEGELTCRELFPKLVGRASLEAVKGISYWREGAIVHTPDRDLLVDLDEIPMPARHLAPTTASYRQEAYYRRRPTFEVITTSRGCPFNCIFCAAQVLTARRYRFRSVDAVMEEVEYCVERLGARQLYWEDDNLVVSRRRFFELTERFLLKGYHKRVISFAQTRVDAVDPEVLGRMKECGIINIGYGMESGVPRLLEVLKKGITIEQIEQAVGYTKEAGLEVRGTFILGIPTETWEESEQTIRFAYGLGLDLARFVPATPYPGTELWDIALQEGWQFPGDWERFSLYVGYTDSDPVYAPRGRSPRELKQLQRRANRGFFLRPQTLWAIGRRRAFAWRELPGLATDFFRLLRATV